MFSACPRRQINDINEVSIRPAMGGDRGVHAESHMTEALIRENETHLRGPRGARKCHSKLAAGPVCCYFISPTALGKIKREVTTSPASKWEAQKRAYPKFASLAHAPYLKTGGWEGCSWHQTRNDKNLAR